MSLVGQRVGLSGAEVFERVEAKAMTHFISPRHRICLDNVIRRPTEQAEKKSRKVGTAKRAGYAMAARFVKRLSKEVMA